jgi:hypothetical protein
MAIIKSISITWAENVTCTEDRISGYITLVLEPEGDIQRARRKWKDNIKMDSKYGVYEGLDWFRACQDTTQ